MASFSPQLCFIRVMAAHQGEGALPKVTWWGATWSSKRMQLHKGLLNLDPGFQRPGSGNRAAKAAVVLPGTKRGVPTPTPHPPPPDRTMTSEQQHSVLGKETEQGKRRPKASGIFQSSDELRQV